MNMQTTTLLNLTTPMSRDPRDSERTPLYLLFDTGSVKTLLQRLLTKCIDSRSWSIVWCQPSVGRLLFLTS